MGGKQLDQKDMFGRKWKYKTRPTYPLSGGPTNYFDSKEKLSKYIEDVEWVRSIQKDNKC